MATRMQQRRGTAAQWVSTNDGDGPVLNAGEIGYETDTGKFKIGDGATAWDSLPYFVDATTLGGSIDDYIPLTQKGTANGVAELDAEGKLKSAQIPNIEEITQDILDTALVAGTGLDKTYNDVANTYTMDIDSTVATLTGTQTLTGKTIDIASNTLTGVAPLNSPTFTGTVTLPTGTVTAGMILDGTIVNADINASAAIAQSKVDGLTTDLAAKLALAGGTMTGAIAMGTNKITGLGTPTDSTDAATKSYVDAVTEGLHIHEAVVAATTANVTLSSALENGDTLDGITLATGNRILVKNQSTASENGIYVVQASGQPTRATDFDTATEVDSGDFVFVYSGTVNGGTGWVQTNRPATIGTDAIAFTQFSGAGTYTAGTGLTLTGTSFSVTEPVASQSGNSGKYLTTDGTSTSWATVSGYSAPTLGSTSIASGSTNTTLVGFTKLRSDVFTTLDADGYEVDLEAMQIMGAL